MTQNEILTKMGQLSKELDADPHNRAKQKEINDLAEALMAAAGAEMHTVSLTELGLK